jgi:hypothetical protein
MSNSIVRSLVPAALVLACGSALAAPSIMVTTAPVGRSDLLVSVDYQADMAHPVAVAHITIGVKDAMISDRRINLKQCAEVQKGTIWTGCSTKRGDFTLLVDASGGNTPIASGNLATVTLPKAVLELDGAGRLTLPFVELTKADGTKVQAEVVADIVEAPAGRGRQSK